VNKSEMLYFQYHNCQFMLNDFVMFDIFKFYRIQILDQLLMHKKVNPGF
jgi:hypothetical protein